MLGFFALPGYLGGLVELSGIKPLTLSKFTPSFLIN